jgi:hypothetical protein
LSVSKTLNNEATQGTLGIFILLEAVFFIPVSKILLGFQEDLAVVMQEWLIWENPSMEQAADAEKSGSSRREPQCYVSLRTVRNWLVENSNSEYPHLVQGCG